MRNYSKKLFAAICIISSIILISACSQLGLSQKSTLSFNMNLSRAAVSMESFEEVFVSVKLRGSYEAEATKVYDKEKELKFVFYSVPVAANIYAAVEIYTYAKFSEDADTEKLVLYSGKSETQTITEGVNTLNVKLQKVYEELEEDPDNPDEPVVEPDDKEKDDSEKNPDDKEKDDEDSEKNPDDKEKTDEETEKDPDDPEKTEEEKPVEFNVIIKTDTSYIVNNPTFTKEYKKEKLKTNKIHFNLTEDEECFVWSPEGDVNLSDYQKAIITYKGTDLKTDEENVIAFKTMRTSYRNYYRDQKPVSAESKTYEMPIPQGKGSLVLGIENKWDSEKGGFQNDFTFEVEKIELVKDAELAIDYGDKYTEEGNKIEFLHNINNDTDWSVGPNAIKWTSKEYEEHGNDSGWAAGYWEFSKLSEYDMIAITVKGLNPNSNGMKFTVGGYLPYYSGETAEGKTEVHSSYSRYVPLENENESVCIKVNIADISTYKADDGSEITFKPKAIEFLNQSFEGDWGSDMFWGDDWTLVIEKIELIKGETYDEVYDYKEIPVNNNWYYKLFNESKSVITCKEASEDSITFTVNRDLTDEELRLQVIFGNMLYEAGKTYLCSYKVKGPVTETEKSISVCCWVPRDETYTNGTQMSLLSKYNSEGFTGHSFVINCDATNTGCILFFPKVPGEYTFSEVSVKEIDPANQENTNCKLEINLPSVNAGDIEVTVTVQGAEFPTSENLIQGIYKAQEVIFTAPEGLGSYSWKLKLKGEVIFTSTENTFEFNAQNLIAGEYYDLVLFTDDKSYTRQLKISECE